MQAELKGKLHLEEGECAQHEMQKEPTIALQAMGIEGEGGQHTTTSHLFKGTQAKGLLKFLK